MKSGEGNRMSTRKKILGELLKALQKNGGKMKYEDLFGSTVLKHGTTEKTFWEYLNALKVSGYIDYNEIYLSNMGPSETIILLK
jgi:hypothetical protein